MPYRVYKITNTLDGKTYIGYTSGTLARRFRDHSYANPKCKMLIKDAMVKHGRDNFIIEELKVFDSIEEATSYETQLINELKPEYNLCTVSRAKYPRKAREVGDGSPTGRFSEKGLSNLQQPKTPEMKDKVRKPITLIKEGIVKHFASTHEASLLIGVSNGMVSTVRTGNRPSANGWTLYNGANT